ncbi:hypothetical protein QFZ63_004298 [Streptomyces sp. B3I7]|uniref:DUF397 domain-containing protein n=1 Tax=Streptomyces sp. B3I7 TaxID=3042269 RepID=UPI00278291A9|nr:DUF397 domain-containing protein [Streptomyces sp. B3I7]MDQ0812584.1 hypothetical protein [Streptomyces sp. B3I7]
MPIPASAWQKSSYCAQGNSCVHVAADPAGVVLVTESGDPAGTVVAAPGAAFGALLRTLKSREKTGV